MAPGNNNKSTSFQNEVVGAVINESSFVTECDETPKNFVAPAENVDNVSFDRTAAKTNDSLGQNTLPIL